MIIKTKYTLFSFLKLFIIVSVSFMLMFFLIDILEGLNDLVKRGDAFDAVKSFYRLPSIFVEISPVLTFLSGMFLLGEMIKYGEIRILEISGIKPLKLLAVFFLCGTVISAAAFYIKNFTAPACLKRINKPAEIKVVNFSSPGYLLYSEKFTPPGTFRKIQVSVISESGGIMTVNAASAVYGGDNIWTFGSGRIWYFGSDGSMEKSENFSVKKLHIMLEPGLIMDASRNLDEFSYAELKDMMRKLEGLNILPVSVKSSLHERFAYPLLNLFLLFILFPFFYVRHKISRVFVLGLSILLSFISYGVFSSGLTLAKAGKMPVFVGVWLMHILITASLVLFFFRLSLLSKKTKSDII
ncbi:MAG: LptF/LptG family permease [Candidatus Omnitrophica bacterium]|nr:LptF/LptG family permease [Candidatus Omnitrophota bacterium]